MYALVIGRAFPKKKTGMMGIFEYEQAVALKKNGFQTVYCFCDTRSIKTLRVLNYLELNDHNIPVYGYHFPIGGMPRSLFDRLKTNKYIKLIKKIIDTYGVPDIIHIHFPLLTLNEDVWSILKGLNKPIVVTEHWTKVQTKTIEPFRIDLLKKIVEEADSFICVGDLLRKSVIELTRTKQEIKVIPNMVNSAFYYKEQKEAFKERFDFITVGRLVEVKRFEHTIEAFAKAFKKNEKVHLHVVGNGPLFNKLQNQIKELGMKDRITMHGFLSRNETANLIRQSDAFVSASILETFGVPFIEAMACGKPVIGIKGGPIDVYIKQVNGQLFNSGSLDELSIALEYMYQNKSIFDGRLIAEKANSWFSEEAVIKKIKKVFLESMNKTNN